MPACKDNAPTSCSDEGLHVTENLKLFLAKVPVLDILGKCVQIDSSVLYDVDEYVQLVCKYLKAFDDGTINRLHLPGKTLLLSFVLVVSW